MKLDVQTLVVVVIVNWFAIAVSLPLALGWRVSIAARCVQAAVIAQALAWASFFVGRASADRFFWSLCVALLGASLVLMWNATRRWLGPRPAGPLLWLLAVATPIGYSIGFASYPQRVAWSHFGLAMQIAVVCIALVWPSERGGRRWRALVFVALAGLAAVTVWRGVLGAFYTERYPYFGAPHPGDIVGTLWNHTALMLTTVGLLAAWRDEAECELRLQATTDALTGLLNRRAFREIAEGALSRGARYGETQSVLMIDLDHFKRINDRRGHVAGDRVLELFAGALRVALRRGDIACRYGGEEFCALLSHADAAAAAEFDSRLRGEVVRHCAAAGEAEAPTFSAGLAVQPASGGSLDELLGQADAALYRAKAAGRNRLVGDAPPAVTASA